MDQKLVLRNLAGMGSSPMVPTKAASTKLAPTHKFMAQDPLQQTYDAIVVGSGATGGWAPKPLSEAGLKVALAEAGPAVTPRKFNKNMSAVKLKYGNDQPQVRGRRPIQR